MRPLTSATATSLTPTGIGGPVCQDSADGSADGADVADPPCGTERVAGCEEGPGDPPEHALTAAVITRATAHAERERRGRRIPEAGGSRTRRMHRVSPSGCCRR